MAGRGDGERERGREVIDIYVREDALISRLPYATGHQPGMEPATQVCALTQMDLATFGRMEPCSRTRELPVLDW